MKFLKVCVKKAPGSVNQERQDYKALKAIWRWIVCPTFDNVNRLTSLRYGGPQEILGFKLET